MKRMLMVVMTATIFFMVATFGSMEVKATSIGASIVEYGKQFMSVPYVWGGTSPSGFDCSGFTQYVYKNEAGVSIPRTTDQQYKIGTSVDKSDLQPGDLIFYKNTYRKGISHVGVYAGNDMVLNATTSKGVALVSMDDPYWGPKYAGAKRVLEEENIPEWFTDVSEASATYAAIKEMSEKEIITGFEDATFRPDEKVTRGQTAAIINRVLQLKPKVMSHFTDVPKSYRFAYDIAAIREAGIVNGFEDRTFRPNDNMTRNEMAAILERAFELKASQTASAHIEYEDIRPDHWAYNGIVTMISIDQTGFFKGDKFYGTHYATREAFTVGVYNAMNTQ